MSRMLVAPLFLLWACGLAAAQEGKVPTADEVFARLRERAERLGSLRATLEIQGYERGYLSKARKSLEFRAPGCLRLESLPHDDTEHARLFLQPEIAVVTPAGPWTYLVWRDEVLSGPPDRWNWNGGPTPEGWEKVGRLFAALLAPEGFYKDYDIRRIFSDVLAGKPCHLLLLAKKDSRPDRVWVDPERWTILKVQLLYCPERWRPEPEDALTVVRQQEVKPGVWLPTEIRLALDAQGQVARVRDLEVGRLPSPDRFALPKDVPLARRSPAAGKGLEHVKVELHAETGMSTTTYILNPCYLDPKAPNETDPAVHLRRFIARNPSIRAAYEELMSYYLQTDDRKAAKRVEEEEAKARPDDPHLRWRALFARFDEEPTEENAEKLAPLIKEADLALETRLRAQVASGNHAAARKTARQVIDHMESHESKRGLAFATLAYTAEKGGWLPELRQECEARAAANPPSELHLRLLLCLLPYLHAQAGEKPRYADCWLRIAEARRDSPEVQLECAAALSYDKPDGPMAGLRLCKQLFDSLPEDAYALRVEARAHLACLDPFSGKDRAAPNAMVRVLEADLIEEPAKLTEAQRLWRHRILASWFTRADQHRALEHVAEAARLSPADESLQFLLVKQGLRAGETDQALALFDRLRAKHPGRPELWLACGRALPAKAMPERAREVIEGLAACAPTDHETLGLARSLAVTMEHFDEAARRSLEMADRRTNDLLSRLFLKRDAAFYLMEGQDAEGAVARWLDVIQDAGKAPQPAADRLVRVFVGEWAGPRRIAMRDMGTKRDLDWIGGGWIPALEAALERAGKAAPAAERAALHFALGSAWRAVGQPQKAAPAYARGIKLLPDFKEGKKWLDEFAPDFRLDDF